MLLKLRRIDFLHIPPKLRRISNGREAKIEVSRKMSCIIIIVLKNSSNHINLSVFKYFFRRFPVNSKFSFSNNWSRVNQNIVK